MVKLHDQDHVVNHHAQAKVDSKNLWAHEAIPNSICTLKVDSLMQSLE
jgi:hypothetical protein